MLPIPSTLPDVVATAAATVSVYNFYWKSALNLKCPSYNFFPPSADTEYHSASVPCAWCVFVCMCRDMRHLHRYPKGRQAPLKIFIEMHNVLPLLRSASFGVIFSHDVGWICSLQLLLSSFSLAHICICICAHATSFLAHTHTFLLIKFFTDLEKNYFGFSLHGCLLQLYCGRVKYIFASYTHTDYRKM